MRKLRGKKWASISPPLDDDEHIGVNVEYAPEASKAYFGNRLGGETQFY